MLKITKEEAFALVKAGIKYGEGGIFVSNKSHKKKYYLCEERANIQMLKNYQASVRQN